jgi:hypothetical protein
MLRAALRVAEGVSFDWAQDNPECNRRVAGTGAPRYKGDDATRSAGSTKVDDLLCLRPRFADKQ